MAWQRDSGYNQRAGVEGQFARWKQVIGDGLRFHSDEARATEVAIAAQVLNRMLDLDARTPSASPDQQRGMGPPLPLPPPCNTLSVGRCKPCNRTKPTPFQIPQPMKHPTRHTRLSSTPPKSRQSLYGISALGVSGRSLYTPAYRHDSLPLLFLHQCPLVCKSGISTFIKGRTRPRKATHEPDYADGGAGIRQGAGPAFCLSPRWKRSRCRSRLAWCCSVASW